MLRGAVLRMWSWLLKVNNGAGLANHGYCRPMQLLHGSQNTPTARVGLMLRWQPAPLRVEATGQQGMAMAGNKAAIEGRRPWQPR